ncbi:MAG: hypothetical protein WC028_21210 [Candidatus Obscuribacterales bacterium]
MNKRARPILLVSLLTMICSSALAAKKEEVFEDSYRAPNSFQGKAVVLPIGTSFEGRIQSTIGSSASRPGERFSVEVSAPVLANGTEVLIPSGTEVIGEVVEAISSSKQPQQKGFPRPLGKLRVQLMSIRMPSGVTLPLVASLCGEATANQKSGSGGLNARKSSVAYVGSQAGFDAVNPALNNKRDPRTGKIAVLKRDDILKDPILGEAANSGGGNNNSLVRSLVKRGRDLYIYSGSPLTVKLDAPLKISFAASSGQSSIDSAVLDEPAPTKGKSGKRFAKERPAPEPEAEASSQNAPASTGSMPNSNSGSGNSGNSNNGAPRPRATGPGSDF